MDTHGPSLLLTLVVSGCCTPSRISLTAALLLPHLQPDSSLIAHLEIY